MKQLSANWGCVRKKQKVLSFIKQLLGDGGSSHDAPLHHLLGDLTGDHARGLRVLRAHHHPFCWQSESGHVQHILVCFVFLFKAEQGLNRCFGVPEKKGSLTSVWETFVRVLTSVGMWKTSRLTIDWLLY